MSGSLSQAPSGVLSQATAKDLKETSNGRVPPVFPAAVALRSLSGIGGREGKGRKGQGRARAGTSAESQKSLADLAESSS